MSSTNTRQGATTVKKIPLTSRKRNEAIDITEAVRAYLGEAKARTGVVTVYSPHTTAGITVNENSDPDVRFDLMGHLNRLVPPDPNFSHVEGNSDAHIKASLIGCSQSIPVEDGDVLLGTWQAIYFMDFDGPREREAWLSFTPGGPLPQAS